jgi:hypothetical protein
MKKNPPLTDSHRIGKTAGAVLKETFPDLSVDRLLTRPRDAIKVCVKTSKRLGRQLTHEEILKELLNARKRGDLSEKK